MADELLRAMLWLYKSGGLFFFHSFFGRHRFLLAAWKSTGTLLGERDMAECWSGFKLYAVGQKAFPIPLGERTNSSPRCDKVTYVFWCCVRRCIARLACAGLMNHLHMKAWVGACGGSGRCAATMDVEDGVEEQPV